MRKKKQEEDMKSIVITPYSKTSRRTNTMEPRSETGDNSCYFPGCRKDANCNCDICLASINATLDLMPMSIQKSSLTKLSASKASERTPIPFRRSILCTPTMGISQISETPPLKSTAQSNLFEKKGDSKKRKRRWGIGFGFDLWRLVVGLCVVFAVDSGFSWMVSGLLKPSLNAEMVRRVGEECWVGSDMNQKLEFLQKHMEGVVDGVRIGNCSYVDSNWELNKDGLLLSSRCSLYKSIAEEVSIWGWPLQTAGLLSAGFSSRSLTIVSGRLTEWPNGKVGFLVHEANSSWVLERLRASAVQMDPNTWVLEYRQNAILESTRFSSVALEFLKIRSLKVAGEIKEQILLLLTIAHQYTHHGDDNKQPT